MISQRRQGLRALLMAASAAAFGPAGSELVGYSNRFPGGFAERMVLQEALQEVLLEAQEMLGLMVRTLEVD